VKTSFCLFLWWRLSVMIIDSKFKVSKLNENENSLYTLFSQRSTIEIFENSFTKRSTQLNLIFLVFSKCYFFGFRSLAAASFGFFKFVTLPLDQMSDWLEGQYLTRIGFTKSFNSKYLFPFFTDLFLRLHV
jgi:hypothetical protein